MSEVYTIHTIKVPKYHSIVHQLPLLCDRTRNLLIWLQIFDWLCNNEVNRVYLAVDLMLSWALNHHASKMLINIDLLPSKTCLITSTNQSVCSVSLYTMIVELEFI